MGVTIECVKTQKGVIDIEQMISSKTVKNSYRVCNDFEDEGFVVVMNINHITDLELRHIIKIVKSRTWSEFISWYYDTYSKSDGDVFVWCKTIREACDFADRKKKEPLQITKPEPEEK